MANTDTGIDLTIDGKVASVVLNAPARRNAFDSAMLSAYEAAIADIERQRDVEVVVLRGKGPAFCAGTDLKELETFSADDTLHWQSRTGRAVERWARLEATTVTAFHGSAIGSGAIIGLASDLRLAADDTRFSFPEVAFGLPLTWSGIPLLTALLGADRTKRLLLMRETLDAAELKQHDLVMDLVPLEGLAAATDRLVSHLLEAPQIGRSMTKRAIHATATSPGFDTGAFEPFLASLSIHARGDRPFVVTRPPQVDANKT